MCHVKRTGRRFLLALGVLALAACSPDGKWLDDDETMWLDERHNGAVVGVEVGAEILVTLHEPTPADLTSSPQGWVVPILSSDCVRFVGAAVSTDGESGQPWSVNYGFEARGIGGATISIPVDRGLFTVRIAVR